MASSEKEEDKVISLSPQELKVVAALASGLSNRDIGKRLKLTTHTVKNYIYRAAGKLDSANRVQLARWYWQRYKG